MVPLSSLPAITTTHDLDGWCARVPSWISPGWLALNVLICLFCALVCTLIAVALPLVGLLSLLLLFGACQHLYRSAHSATLTARGGALRLELRLAGRLRHRQEWALSDLPAVRRRGTTGLEVLHIGEVIVPMSFVPSAELDALVARLEASRRQAQALPVSATPPVPAPLQALAERGLTKA